MGVCARILVSMMAAGAVAGCAAVTEEAGFGEVRQTVAERTGGDIRWRQGTAEDRALDEAVAKLLADGLTADEAVQVALLNNRRLQATYQDLGVAQAALVQAGLLANPIFDAAVMFPLTGGAPDLELSVVQDFLGIFYLPLRTRVAESEFDATKHRVAGAVIDLAGRTRAAFYRAQADVQQLELREQVTRATAVSLEAMQRLRAAGNVTRLDVDNEQALHERARLDLAAAEAGVLASRERLNRLMGLWGAETEWAVAPRLPDLPDTETDLETVERRAVEASLDLAAMRSELEAFGRQLGLTEASALLPFADAGAAAERDDRDWKVGPVLALPIPLFDLGQARVATAQAEFRRRHQRYWALAVEIRSATRAARETLRAARDMARHYRDVMLPLSERIVEETQKRYNAMQLGVFQLLLAKQQQIATGAAYIEALRAYWVARAELDQILQGRLSDMAPEIDARAGASMSPGMARPGADG